MFLKRLSCATCAGLRLAALVIVFWLAAPSVEVSLAEERAVVDVKLVLAVDVSWSMDHDEQRIQRDGYAAAFQSEEVIEAILHGGYGRVAVVYMEWAGTGSQEIVIPWTLIDSAEASHAFADSLREGAPQHFRRTSISDAIDFAAALFDDAPYQAVRRVIDLSGDGPNNQGRPVTEARDAAVAAGITINGLPLMTNPAGNDVIFAIPELDSYFADCVIGGNLAFMIPVTSWEEFPVAVRRKLVLELAGGLPQDELSDSPYHEGARFLVRAQATPGLPELSEDETDCLVGERTWDRRDMRWSTPPPL